ncbi:NADH-quinone oxidoreductase subunit G [Sporichthya polymorpha]|uniref:NADH-quinone oxidoreductase subunit G n=1 Tax=Sporichthya polymorpha TaxID=35751 RepID=UPI00035FA81E|nr:NADH-quinone oxidoreductase subunit G [Sporichthya polymorpha]
MTVTVPPSGNPGGELAKPVDLVTLTIDGIEVSVPKGSLIIRAAEQIGIQIPRFCDHPLLDPVGACRQCLVEVEGQRKPLASCTTTVADGMVVQTQLTSPVADKAQQGVMELLLINHPLDCPVCDKGGECPLQNQAMSNGRADSRFTEQKRTFPKPVNISAQVLLDRERCVLCARCTRFSKQIAGDPFIDMFERGALQQVSIYENAPFESYFSGNTIQICPVGALTSAAYRFRSRPFDLVSTPSVCEHCSGGCALRTDHRRGKVLRRLAAEDPEVNEEWNCDKGRFAFTYATRPDRLSTPLIRDTDGELKPASWREALALVAERLENDRGRAAVLTGGRLTLEDNYAYAKFARVCLDTNDIDFRSRGHSAEEADFLATHVAGKGLFAGTPNAVTFGAIEAAPAVLLVGLEAEEEAASIFLRLRKAHLARRMPIFSIAPFASNGLAKAGGRLLPTVPGGEAAVLDSLGSGGEVADLLRQPGAVILAGERLAVAPGALSAVARLASSTGARVAWIPRRAGDRAAVEAGALPTLLPGGRPVADPEARAQVAAAWGVESLPSLAGRDTAGILAAISAHQISSLVVAGVDADDLPDPSNALIAFSLVDFLVSIEVRASEVTERAHVVFPVPPVAEKSGTFLNWEGRMRSFAQALQGASPMTDLRVLEAIADEMDRSLGLRDGAAARDELAALGRWSGPVAASNVPAPNAPAPRLGEAVLASWNLLLDLGRMQDGEPHLARTARKPVVRLSAATAEEIGASDGGLVVVTTDRGTVTLPLTVTDMPDRVVWLPMKSPGSAVRRDLGVDAGAVVRIHAGGSL